MEVIETPVASQPSLDNYGASSVRVGGAQLEDLKALDFASALRRTPGVTISRFNQVGAFGGSEGGAIFLRGLGSSRPGGEIKTLVNGVPKMNGVFNHPLLDLLSVDIAESIQVMTRATPTSYGNAFAAINVTTPRLEKEGRLLSTRFAAGSFGTMMARVDGAIKQGAYDAYFSQSVRRSDGARPDSEGRLENSYLHLGASLGAQWAFSYELNHTSNRSTDPGSTLTLSSASSTKGETYETEDWLHIGTLSHNHGKSYGSLRVYRSDGEGNWTRRQYSGNSDSLNDWSLYGLRWRETLNVCAGGEIVAGTDLDYTRGETISIPKTGVASHFGPETVRLLSPYAGFSQTLELGETLKLVPSVGLRHYAHDELGDQWAPQAGIILSAGQTRLHASYGRGVSYPGLEVQAFSAVVIPALGQSWRMLDPETVDQYELGVRHSFRSGNAVALTLFRNEVSQRYVVVPPPPPPPRYVNLEDYRTEGVELSTEVTVGRSLALFGAAAWLRASPSDIPYAPHGSYTGGVNWRPAADWKLSVDASYVTSMRVASQARTAGAPNLVGVGAQFLLNARLSRSLKFGAEQGAVAEVYVAGENLTDRDFAYTPGYPIPGINGVFGIRIDW